MKLEMCESLMYSWMRHVMGCTIVQTNWKVSPEWQLKNIDEVGLLLDLFSKQFNVFENNSSLDQIIRQGECDVIGIDLSGSKNKIYAAEVAFHRNGLGYKNNIQKVTEKVIRTAFCIYLTTSIKKAEILFVSPRIANKVCDEIIKSLNDITNVFTNNGFDYKFRLIANKEFQDIILDPIMLASNSVDDTSELFLRSQQLIALFYPFDINPLRVTGDLKIGKLAQVFFGKFAKEGKLTAKEVEKLQMPEYSKNELGLNFPCLVKEGTEFNTLRYYTTPIDIREEKYYLCSQWFETNRNKLENWIDLICNKS